MFTYSKGLKVLRMLGNAESIIVVFPKLNIILSGGCCPRCIGLATPDKTFPCVSNDNSLFKEDIIVCIVVMYGVHYRNNETALSCVM